MLGLLADNDGPQVPEYPMQTRALLAGSPAIDAGDPTGCFDYDANLLSTDQRHALRVGRCDVGAFEFGSMSLVSIFANGFESGDTTAWSTGVP